MKQEVWNSAVDELRKQVQLVEKQVKQKEQEEKERKEQEIFETSVTIASEVVRRIGETLMGVILTLPRHSGATTYVIGNQIKEDNKEINPSQILQLLEVSGLSVIDMKEQKFTDLAIDAEEFCSFAITVRQKE